jgi:fucose 4-O-acetylase-like acetyltransferase
MRQRIHYIDAIKALTIYLVIVGHFIAIIPSGQWGRITRDVIYSFHMPLFMILSGYFSKSSFSRSFKEFISNKSITLLLPVVTWTILISVYSLSVGNSTERIITEIKGNSWFLKTLFACYVVVYLLKRTKLPDIVACAASLVFFFVIPKGCTFQFNWMLSFFWLGYFLQKYCPTIFEHKKLLLFAVPLYAIGLYAMFKYDCTQVVLISVDSLSRNWPLVILRYWVSISGSLTFAGIVCLTYRLIYKSRECLMSSCGKYTLGIYVMQTFLIQYLIPDVFQFAISEFAGFVLLFVTSIITCALCIFFIILCSKSIILDIILFGGQYHKKSSVGSNKLMKKA